MRILPLIPTPRTSRRVEAGTIVDLARFGQIVEPDPKASYTALLKGLVTEPTRVRMESAPGTIRLEWAELHRTDAYSLSIRDEEIVIRAAGHAGFVHGCAAVAQLCDHGGALPEADIEDQPEYEWRGLTLDVARTAVTLGELKRIIDLLCLYRMSMLHLHLTDDQAWRYRVPGWPGLTSGGLHYADDELRELQAYAAARAVEVVFEADLPGHARAAIAAYPVLAEGVDATAQTDTLLPFTAPLDARRAPVARFISDAVNALANFTAGRYLHIGGDEVFGADEGIISASIAVSGAAAAAKGKRPVFWQEAARSTLPPGSVVQHWVTPDMMGVPATESELAASPIFSALPFTFEQVRTFARMYEQTKYDLERGLAQGASVLLSPQSHLYLDAPYDPAVVPESQRGIAERLGLRIYRRHRTDTVLKWQRDAVDAPRDRVVGISAALWCETVQDFDDLTTLLLPRLPAVAEQAWALRPAPWSEFRESLATQSRYWRRLGIAYMETTDVAWSPT